MDSVLIAHWLFWQLIGKSPLRVIDEQWWDVIGGEWWLSERRVLNLNLHEHWGCIMTSNSIKVGTFINHSFKWSFGNDQLTWLLSYVHRSIVTGRSRVVQWMVVFTSPSGIKTSAYICRYRLECDFNWYVRAYSPGLVEWSPVYWIDRLFIWYFAPKRLLWHCHQSRSGPI